MEQERELINRAKKGDTTAFEALVTANEHRVYNLALRMTGHPEDARDMAQEAFLTAFQRLGTFKMESSFSTWLYRLTTNLCIDFLRREKKKRAASVPIEDREGRPIDLPDTHPDPHETVEDRELKHVVEIGLQKLTEEHREILILREICGFSYEEIGAVLKLEPGTVKSRIARARLHLREILLADGNFPVPAASKKAGKEAPV